MGDEGRHDEGRGVNGGPSVRRSSHGSKVEVGIPYGSCHAARRLIDHKEVRARMLSEPISPLARCRGRHVTWPAARVRRRPWCMRSCLNCHSPFPSALTHCLGTEHGKSRARECTSLGIRFLARSASAYDGNVHPNIRQMASFKYVTPGSQDLKPCAMACSRIPDATRNT